MLLRSGIEVTGKRLNSNLLMEAASSVSPQASSSQNQVWREEGVLCCCDRWNDGEKYHRYP